MVTNLIDENTGPFGGSLRTGTRVASPSMSAITPATNIVMAENEASLSAPDRPSHCEPQQQTLFLFGENSSMTQDSKALTAPCSETKANIKVPSLSDRLTQSLISAGLVRGITPTSVRKQLGAVIPVTALWPLDGGSAA